ncbi:chloride channel protein [Colwellia sp. MB02u-18]|uniref:chloride channel protein n=1 Tax=unclassified Colwellia TaxID=196834 RepID=UPI0015F373B5|nr:MULTISPECIES: chloride channel protein [unclassified Colwellia]MBA6223704.1 chloride channel protein [Colwellia sp. MB3u-45]MBA6268434.1 chloride channel protein [Colwellia sp. MB3u-43]MBA6319885.1 chloride channel protein [Colwellia sp. MB02u-19]MBA6324571.1 chloride channel protein [Colwellia sp. MB02u-18]MBA6330726.1 chloride channel protein [Colwellia sp. MB02u-12]
MKTITQLKKRLAVPQTSWQLCLLAAIGGFASALLVVLFIFTIEGIQLFFLPEKDDYNSISALSRFQLPIMGAVVILLFAWLTGYKYIRSGIPFVLHRLKVANGVMPFRNTVNQFIGSATALAAGFSVGREGPAVHLGAACSSYIANKLNLPYNAIRSLSACGIAAGIAACFNTPIAAVLFVMEVILREYKVHIFIPVMIAALVGSMTTSHIFGVNHEFGHFTAITLNIDHYLVLAVLGMVLGVFAFIFNRNLILVIKHSARFHLVPRILTAALITGSLGYALPYAMGTDLSAINFSLQNSLELQLLLGLLVAKVLMTIFALGLGIPGGVIGPILGIGAIAGTCGSVVASYFIGGNISASDFALMGMAGFMAATLNAPLAALLCVVELSNQIEIIVPAMIVITSACVFSGQFFGNRSIFILQLEIQGLPYRQPPIEKFLQRIGVIGVMDERITLLRQVDDKTIATALSKQKPQDNVIHQIKQPDETTQFVFYQQSMTDIDAKPTLTKHTLIPLSSQSTLTEAYLLLMKKRTGGVYIYQDNPDEIMGIITFDYISAYLLKGKTN